MAMVAARRPLLTHLRMPVARPVAAVAATTAAGTVPTARRLLSSTTEETKGSFLDKGEVASRVVSVVKNFQKVEPAKVDCLLERGFREQAMQIFQSLYTALAYDVFGNITFGSREDV